MQPLVKLQLIGANQKIQIFRGVLVWLGLIGLVLVSTNTSNAAEPDGTVDFTFSSPYHYESNNSPYVWRQVLQTAQQADGKILFTFVQMRDEMICDQTGCVHFYPTEYILTRLNKDGGEDSSFARKSFVNSLTIDALLVQSDDKIVVAGKLNANSYYIERYNKDGSLDTSFDATTNNSFFNSSVTQLIQQPDGKIVIAGNFTSYNNTTRKGIVRLHNDGSLDTIFNSAGENISYISNVLVQNDGKILIAGHRGDNNVWTINRLNNNGSLDSSFNSALIIPNSQNDNVISTMVLQPDGKIIVAGTRSDPVNSSYLYLLRLNNNGSLDSSFNSPITSNSPTASIKALLIQPDDKILVAGTLFNAANDQPLRRIARLNFNGSLDAGFISDNAYYSGNTGYIGTILLQADKKILIGGSFEINGIGTAYSNYYLARLYNSVKVKAESNITLSSSANPSLVWYSVTFFAQLSPENASGTVRFNFNFANGTNASSNPVEIVNGSAQYYTSTIETESYIVTASYSGDVNYLPGNSAGYTQYQVSGCNPLLVISSTDDWQSSSCGTFSYAVTHAISGKIKFDLPAGINVINISGTPTFILKPGVTIDGDTNGVILDGTGTSGDGLRLSGNNTLTNLTIRGFGGRALIATGKTNRLYHVKLEN